MDKQSFFQADERPESLLWTLAQMELDLYRVGKRKTARSAPDRLWRVNVGGWNYSAFRKSMVIVLPSYVHCPW